MTIFPARRDGKGVLRATVEALRSNARNSPAGRHQSDIQDGGLGVQRKTSVTSNPLDENLISEKNEAETRGLFMCAIEATPAIRALEDRVMARRASPLPTETHHANWLLQPVLAGSRAYGRGAPMQVS